ncbi:acetolactate decarboxylase [Fulvivirga sp. M361]|uniref:acetolactate decarboxylase n=1 Tax=Fulvivirga sp. M361 TaxID=2594266 RepID=UPI00117A997D|nr:acetolactate decarboxylase [Fulvivirga sp. M361]TRX48210.1 acetolactate decarboxylase [Fulvivirga sp. M361]
MKVFNPFLTALVLLIACNQNQHSVPVAGSTEETIVEKEKSDVFYHYSIWYAFVNKIFEGELTAKELKERGDIALGSYNLLDGELIMLDGVLFKATEDGKVTRVKDDDKIVYANAAFFDVEQSFEIKEVDNYKSLREKINEQLPSKNIFYAFKIHGDFKKMKCGGLNKQDKPFEDGLDVLIPNRPVFERENFSGTMVGFFCPEFIGNINVAAYHLHFVSDDETFAGHVMEFEAENLKVEMDYIYEYQFAVPRSPEYLNGNFENEFQYKKK